MRLPFQRQRLVPDVLTDQLAADEVVTAVGATDDGRTLVTTRRGLWVVREAAAERFGWDRIAKAVLDGGVLTLIPLKDELDDVDGLQVVRDDRPVQFRLARPAKVTDQVHNRVRRSVAASRYLPWPGAGGWVALRRVPGQDGLTAQLRLDPSADPWARGFLAAAKQVVADLRAGPTFGTTGVD